MAVELAEGELAQSVTDIIDECRQRFTFCQDAEGVNRSEFESDKKFVYGDQWDPTIRDERFADRRPALTVNISDAICRRVVNNCRENRPRIAVHPVGNGASIQTAKVFDGLIRHIEYASNAEYHYDSAVENAVHGGFGYIGIDAEYVNDKSLDQELRVVGWANPLVCYADPNSRLPDGSDYEFFLETIFMKRTEYRLKYGHLDNEGWRWAGKGDDVPDWSNKEELRICKYWRVERFKDELAVNYSGQLAWRSESPRGTLVDGPKRTVYRKKVCAYLLTAFKQLGPTLEWPGKWIPRVPVYGRRMDLNGRVQTKGMMRDLKHPAIIYNYATTKETEQYALNPNAQWVGPAGFMEGKEQGWRDANRKPIVALEYIPVKTENGELLPPPQRMDPPAINAGFSEWAERTKSDFLHVAGMPHDPEMDKKGEVISGLAIRRRQGISDVSNFDFYDNLTRSLRHLGKIIVDLVPHYYDTPRVIRIIQEDGTPQTAALNQPQLDPMTQAVIKIENDMTVGDYEVVVDTGPSYQTKREESAEALLELLGTPLGQMVAQAAGDKIVRQFDFADAEGVADRLAALIPAAQMEGLKGIEDPKAKALISSLMGQLKQMQQQQMALELELHDKRGIEQMKQQGETQRVHMKETGMTERELLKLHGKADDTHVKALTSHNVAEIGAAAQIITKGMEHKHEAAMGERELAHADRMADKELGFDLYEGERGREHEAGEAEKDRAYESSEAKKGRDHESQEASRERKHGATEAQHQRGHEARQGSADRNSRK